MKCPKCGSEMVFMWDLNPPNYESDNERYVCKCGHEEPLAIGPAQARTQARTRVYRGRKK